MNGFLRLIQRLYGLGLMAVCVFGLVCGGCHQTESFWALTEVSTSLPQIDGQDRSVRRAGAAPELLAVWPQGNQTVLVATHLRDDPARRYDESSRTFVVVLEGPPARGRYDVTPENGRLILQSAWLPARIPYMGIEGRVEILSVRDDKIKAFCVLRNVLAKARSKSYVIRGWYDFDRAGFSDLRLRQAGIELGGARPAAE